MKYTLLPHIDTPKDLKKLSQDELPVLVEELRDFMNNTSSIKQGHLHASLGVVELTVMLHYIFDFSEDKLVWDVGHQSYAYKILTGRREAFISNRQLGGISGFPSISESIYDHFGTGHSSTSISAVLGMAISSMLTGQQRHHIAVIGDASIASGMAWEALNHLATTKANVLIILNDNNMGIDNSTGGLKEYLNTIDEHHNIYNTLFQLDYTGVVDGHHLSQLYECLHEIQQQSGTKLLHLKTIKGNGAKENTAVVTTATQEHKYQDVFGKTLVSLAEQNPKIVGVTAAMPTGTSMNLFIDKFPDRGFDVGIAEQHAITFCAGMATQGLIPYCAIYSTFLQRGIDQIIHDVAIQKLPVIFCIDRGGLVGDDGVTHHGVFDLAILRSIPNMMIYAPRDEVQLRNILYTAQLGIEYPIAIRYPKGAGQIINWEQPFEAIEIGKAEILTQSTSNHLAILSIGTMAINVQHAIKKCNHSNKVSHYDIGFLKPIDTELLHKIFDRYSYIVTIEDGVIKGGLASEIIEFANQHHYHNPVKCLGIRDEFVTHGTVEELQQLAGIDTVSIRRLIDKIIQ